MTAIFGFLRTTSRPLPPDFDEGLVSLAQYSQELGKDAFGYITVNEDGAPRLPEIAQYRFPVLPDFKVEDVRSFFGVCFSEGTLEESTTAPLPRRMPLWSTRSGWTVIANGYVADDVYDDAYSLSAVPRLIAERGITACDKLPFSSLVIAATNGPGRLWLYRDHLPLYLWYSAPLQTYIFSSRENGNECFREEYRLARKDFPPFSWAYQFSPSGNVNVLTSPPPDNQQRAAVLCSGGMDSYLLAHHAAENHPDVRLLYVDYGSVVHAQEIVACVTLSDQIGAQLVRCDGSWLGKLGESALTDEDSDDEEPDRFYVPARNLYLLASAAAYCDAHDVGALYVGLTAEDASTSFVDTTAEFLGAMERTINLGTRATPEVRAPFMRSSKIDLVKRAQLNGIDISPSWSCYVDGDYHCGECPSCLQRQRAFAQAKIPDPTEYVE